MKLEDVTPGCRLDIVKETKNSETGVTDYKTYKSSLYSVLDEHLIEVSVPMEKMTLIPLHEGEEYAFMFITDAGVERAPGKIVDRYQKDNFHLLKVELLDSLCKYQRREFYRMDCMMPVEFYELPYSDSEVHMDLIYRAENNQLVLNQSKRNVGICLDISGGGIRFTSASPLTGVNYLFVRLSLYANEKEENLTLIGKLVESDQLRGTTQYSHRVQFLFSNMNRQEKIIRYIFEVERLRRQRDR